MRDQGIVGFIPHGRCSVGMRTYFLLDARRSANLHSLLAFSLQQAPLVPRPPHDSLPASKDKPEWFGRFWLRYPEHNGLIDADFGVFFEYRARARTIMAEFCSAAYGPSGTSTVSIGSAYLCRSILLKWFESLLRPCNWRI